MNDRLLKQLEFLVEIDKIKNIIRKSQLFHDNRYENDAEHSWHIALMAVVLSEHSNENLDILKVIKMLLIHDIVEIDAGDVIVYHKTSENSKEEQQAAERIFGLLPEDQKNEFITLWEEFEERVTAEAKFAAAVDRLEPVMQNMHHDCSTWKNFNIKYEQVVSTNSKIADGSKIIWNYIKEKLDVCREKGLLS